MLFPLTYIAKHRTKRCKHVWSSRRNKCTIDYERLSPSDRRPQPLPHAEPINVSCVIAFTFPPARTAPGIKTIVPHASCPTCLTAEHKNITSGFWEGWTAHIYSTWSLLAATRNDAHYSDPDCWKLFRVSRQAHLRKTQLPRRPTEDRLRFFNVFHEPSNSS